jgi:hypothetical protein
MRKCVLAILVLGSELVAGSIAKAQCREDIDCRGIGACRDGNCVDTDPSWCATDAECPVGQVCAATACVAPRVVPPAPPATPPASVAEGTVTFTSDEPGVEVSELSAESGEYALMCRTPCTLQLTLGPHHLKLGGWEADMMATGWPQEWRYDSDDRAMWGWGIAGAVVGSVAMATGLVVMVAYRPRLWCSSGGWSTSSESDCEHFPEPFYAGVSALATGVVLLVVGIVLGARSEPVLDVTGTNQSGDESASPTFALLPSVGPMAMGDGRTAWGFSLALTL